jgi:hypothetical protein
LVYEKQKEALKSAHKLHGFPFRNYFLNTKVINEAENKIPTNSIKLTGFPMNCEAEKIYHYLENQLAHFSKTFRFYWDKSNNGVVWIDFLSVDESKKAKTLLAESSEYRLTVNYGRMWNNPNLVGGRLPFLREKDEEE